MTRLVAMFSDLESQGLKAAQQRDEGSLNRLLSEDFQVWTPAPPGDPIPREDWLKQVLAQKLESFHIRRMAVRSLNDDTVLASFVLSETVERGGQPVSQDYFVVDLWRRHDNNWQVTDRYMSLVVPASPSVQKEVKPSGKD